MPKEDRRYPPIHPWLYNPLMGLIRFLIRVLVRLHVTGLDNVPTGVPLIYVTNHLHHLDSPVMGVLLPGKPRPLAAEKYMGHIFGPLLRIVGSIFIYRGEVDRSALRQALNVLEDGMPLAVAVEGTRSRSGGLAEGKTGAAYLATRANVPLVPAVTWGTEDIIPAWTHLRRADVYVVFGEPFRLPEGRARSAELEAYTEDIMIRLARMLPEQYRGVYREHPQVAGHTPLIPGQHA